MCFSKDQHKFLPSLPVLLQQLCMAMVQFHPAYSALHAYTSFKVGASSPSFEFIPCCFSQACRAGLPQSPRFPHKPSSPAAGCTQLLLTALDTAPLAALLQPCRNATRACEIVKHHGIRFSNPNTWSILSILTYFTSHLLG